MDKKYYTIGMAGHIDHGKTELTKALTGIDTDRLKEEKERKISIELGYAPLVDNDEYSISIIDVPGHEKFIRQMIAGVAGIDITILVIAGDEGVMPQTIEHLEILTHLEISECIIVTTKMDKVEAEMKELLREDIKSNTKDTIFEDAPLFEVDSLSMSGIFELKEYLLSKINELPTKSANGVFRLPIDQVFQVHGVGTVVRGTVFEGTVSMNDQLTLYPSQKKVQVRNIQQFNQSVERSYAGNRTALALKGVQVKEIERGDVLTDVDNQRVTNRIDVKLNSSPHLKNDIKQRAPIKFHTGTSETYGRIIFFDRNVLNEPRETLYAQIELNEEIYCSRGDRFILRRATPVETIGGGEIVNPTAEKHRFGKQTSLQIEEESKATPEEVLLHELREQPGSDIKALEEKLSLPIDELKSLLEKLQTDGSIVEVKEKYFTVSWIGQRKQYLQQQLTEAHKIYMMRPGLPKSEVVQRLSLTKNASLAIIDYLLDENFLKSDGQYVALPNFKPEVPEEYAKRVETGLDQLKKDGLKVESIDRYFAQKDETIRTEIIKYLIRNQDLIELDNNLYLHKDNYLQAIQGLKNNTDESFETSDAKDYLGVSRKYLIPLLDRMDEEGYTRREESKRYWLK
ncbi:selenocysteine-specific translation elongation factor [Halalkalibacillus sediminis]|uniref:Selenocysteine-specific elongation factor n=1 Tax=Halalkalibacillus sediminis TaxID=2018042 RepID=A0A2I0QWK7_9BACI|nr:selenocysteine-specific translation elongation factor [Halalkalibacillus sediminis]PKR78721.1 selenocysteine-specific translation elongation factor [Halalkalibacillus sediminis]